MIPPYKVGPYYSYKSSYMELQSLYIALYIGNCGVFTPTF